MSKNLNRQPEAANLNSEKTKDIRMTNIIAARGKRFSQVFPVQFKLVWLLILIFSCG
jgi:hypothetical protein